MSRFVRSALAANAATLLTLQAAVAQNPPSIIVAFDVAGPVPVGSWGVALAALLMGVTAAVLLRKRNRAASRLLGAAVVAGAVAAASTAPQTSQAVAVIPPTNMVTSPATALLGGTGPYPFVNATGNTIVIRSITLANPGAYSINSSTTTCDVTGTVSANATCNVGIQFNDD